MKKIYVIKMFFGVVIFLLLNGCLEELQNEPVVLPDNSATYIREVITNVDQTETVINRLHFDPKKFRVEVATSYNLPLKGEVLEGIALKYGATAAINANGFTFPSEYTTLKGISRIKGNWYASSSSKKASVGWNDSSKFKFGILGMEWQIEIGKIKFPLHHINVIRSQKKAVLYTSVYSHRIKPEKLGQEIVIHNGIVIKIQGDSELPVPDRGFIYSVSNDSGIDISGIKVGQKATVSYGFKNYLETSPNMSWNKLPNIVGLGPMLVWEGKSGLELNKTTPVNVPVELYYFYDHYPPIPAIPFKLIKVKEVRKYGKKIQEKFLINRRHPRTAICQTIDESMVFIVVEGRSEGTVGFTLEELRDYLINIVHCHYAVNLDGGGSSSMYFNGKMRGFPAGYLNSKYNLPKKWRELGNAIILLPKR